MEQPLQQQPDTMDDGVDLLALAFTFLREWRVGLVVGTLVLIGGVAYVFHLKPQFEASATFLPHTNTSEANSLASFFSTRTPGDVYIGMMESRTVCENVVDRLNLVASLRVHSRNEACRALGGMAKFRTDPDTFVTVSVRAADAKLATDIANAYLDALQEDNDNMQLTEAARRRQFYERELQQEKNELTIAEEALKNTEQKTGVVQPDLQTQAGLSAISGVRAEIQRVQVQISGLLESETEDNPQVKTLRSQLAELHSQEAQLEASGGGPNGAGLRAGNVPEANLDYERRARDVKYHELQTTALATQYQNARLTESFSSPAFEIIDHAQIPEAKAWPPRTPFLMLVLAASVLSALVAIPVKILFDTLRRNPELRARFAALRSGSSQA